MLPHKKTFKTGIATKTTRLLKKQSNQRLSWLEGLFTPILSESHIVELTISDISGYLGLKVE
jgi:hypothetical protein